MDPKGYSVPCKPPTPTPPLSPGGERKGTVVVQTTANTARKRSNHLEEVLAEKDGLKLQITEKRKPGQPELQEASM